MKELPKQKLIIVGTQAFIALEGETINVAHIRSVEWIVDVNRRFSYLGGEHPYGISSMHHKSDEMLNIAAIPAEILPGLVRVWFAAGDGEDTSRYASCMAECADGQFMIDLFRLQRPRNPYAYRLEEKHEAPF